MTWKKNFRKIPQMILGKLKTIQNPNIVVGCAKTFKQEDLQNGILSHLQINLTDSGLKFPKSIIPTPESGKHSSWNVNGREIKRTDLPKETYYADFDRFSSQGLCRKEEKEEGKT